MKLSKAQQAVVDKMRQGWKLKFGPSGWIMSAKCIIEVKFNTIKGLLRKGIVAPDESFFDPGSIFYRLTEQYKNAPATEGQTP